MSAPRQHAKKARSPRELPANDDDSQAPTTRQLEQKRARNRLSQRYFRERRKLHLRELETRVKSITVPDHERNTLLVEENSKLRSSLLETRKKMAYLKSVIMDVDDSVKILLEAAHKDVVGSNRVNQKGSSDEPPSETIAQASKNVASLEGEPFLISDKPQQSKILEPQYTTEDAGIQNSPSSNPLTNLVDLSAEPVAQSPLTWLMDGHSPELTTVGQETIVAGLDRSFLDHLMFAFPENQPQPPQIAEITWNSSMETDIINPYTGTSLGLNWGLSQQSQMLPTSWSLNLENIEAIVKTHIQQQSGDSKARRLFLSQSCLAIMLIFCRHMWPGPLCLWFGTYCYPMIESVLRWRLCPSPQSYKALPECHIPTELQNKTPHSAIIDWVSIGPLRDRMIENYNFSPQLDTIFVDLMDSGVVELDDMSSIFIGVKKERGFLSIWNIFSAIQNAPIRFLQPTASPQENTLSELSQVYGSELLHTYKMPLPDTKAASGTATSQLIGEWEPMSPAQLFSSPAMAQKLYYHLELYRSDKCWRMDPAFFQKYPLLKWDGYENVIASGTSYRINSRPSFPSSVSASTEKILDDYQRTLNSVRMGQ